MEPRSPSCAASTNPKYRRFGSVGCSDHRRSLLTTVAVVLLLAGCAGSQQSKLSHRQPSLRVADAALAAGAPEVALRIANLTLEREPRSLPAFIAKGDALYAMGERELARVAYRTAVAINPAAVAAELGLGRTLVQSDPSAAEAAFLAVIAEEPYNVAALSNLGIARDLQGRHSDAQDAYRRALEVAPTTSDVKVNLGLSLALSGAKDEAVRVLRDAAADPGAAHDRRKELVGALVLAGDDVEARRLLSGVAAKPQSGSHAYGPATGDAPLSAPVRPLENATSPASQPIAVARSRKPDVGKPLDGPTAATAVGAVPPASDVQTDLRLVPPTVLTAPVVVVARVSQSAPPDVAPPTSHGTAALLSADSVVAIATVRTPGDPSGDSGRPHVIAADAASAPAGTPAASGTAAESTGGGAPSQLALATNLGTPKQSLMHEGAAFVQLASLRSAEDASYEWRRLNRRMPDLLSGRDPTITRADVHGQPYWCLRTFGFANLAEATATCSRMLGASGLRCWARATSN
jgi:Tfp pilus assembly protein PilF